MTIWHLFSVMAFLAPIVPAFQQPRVIHASFGTYAASIFVGVLLGVVWAFALWWLTKKLFTASSSRSESFRVFVAAVTALMSVVWIVGGGMCGDHLVKLILHVA